MMKVCVRHAKEWDADGIILKPSEIVDGEGSETVCRECLGFPERD